MVLVNNRLFKRGVDMDFKDVPMTPSGVGFGTPTRWTFTQYGDILSVYGIRNHITMTFNLKSADDIQNKLRVLYELRDANPMLQDDIQELEERLRLYSDLSIGGYSDQTVSGIREGAHKKHKKGEVYIKQEGTQTRKVVARGPRKVVSAAQEEAIANARQYAHTSEADAKRRKTMSAKSDNKVLGLE